LLFAALTPGCHELYVTDEEEDTGSGYRIFGTKKRGG
jgi:hypothetical protein